MPSPTATTSPPGHQSFAAAGRSPTSTSGGTAEIATVDTKRPLGDRGVLSVMLPAGRQRFKVAALPSPSLRWVPRGRPPCAGPAMTSDLPADHPSALASDHPDALDLLHAQLDEIAGQGRWSYQLTVTGATFAPLIHITADWQLVEYHYADRPLRHELATGRAIGATVSDALHALVAEVRAAVAIEDASDEL
jgi:hypothetical protein